MAEKSSEKEEGAGMPQFKLEVPEFFRPTPQRTLIFSFLSVLAIVCFVFLLTSVLSNRQIGVSVLLLGKDLFYILVVFLLQGALLLNFYAPFLMFGSYYSLLIIFVAFGVQFAYLWVLSCIASNFAERKEWALGAVLLLMMSIAFIITPLKSPYDDIYPKAECFYQIVKSNACYNPDGSWNPAPSKLPAEQYDVPLKCLQADGALDKTPYKYDERNFNCGPPPA